MISDNQHVRHREFIREVRGHSEQGQPVPERLQMRTLPLQERDLEELLKVEKGPTEADPKKSTLLSARETKKPRSLGQTTRGGFGHRIKHRYE